VVFLGYLWIEKMQYVDGLYTGDRHAFFDFCLIFCFIVVTLLTSWLYTMSGKKYTL